VNASVIVNDAPRAKIIAVARSWIGTPFHNLASKKGVGVDCAHFLREVYVEAGVIEPFEIKPYTPQFMLHSDDPKFESYVVRFGEEIAETAVKPGDVVLYKIGRSFCHGAIIVEWPRAIIHAFKSYGRVVESGARESDLLRLKVKFFSKWP